MTIDIESWLTSLGLDDYVDVFIENKIDLDVVHDLAEEDLRELGIPMGHRKRLLRAASALAADQTVPSPHIGTKEPVSGAAIGERRQVTVLFADLAGYTRLSRERDAEETHALLNRYFETVDGIVDSYGGNIDKHIGDSVMAVFGAPIAHTNDPERAVRAACEIHASLQDMSQKVGLDIKAHIGIASGQVVASGTGSAQHKEYTVTGDSVNLASRLDSLAAPGETLISKAVHDATTKIADCQYRGREAIKGLAEPLDTWSVVALTEQASGANPGSFFGRQSELRQFGTLLEEATAHQRGQVLLLRGEPGIGKTRLVDEFAERARKYGAEAHKVQVLDFGVGKGQAPIPALVRSFLEIPSGSNKATRQEALEAFLRVGLLTSDDRIFLNQLLDLPQSEELQFVYQSMDNIARLDGQKDCLMRLISAKAELRPQLLIVEDLHWADQLTLDHIARIANSLRDQPVILILTMRPEGPTGEQEWLATLRGAPVTISELQPFRAEEAIALAQHLATESTGQIETFVARAEGNPLFIEQLMRGAGDSDLPDTLQGVVLARMDKLDQKDREALRAASVIGQRFELDALRFILEDQCFSCEDLVRHRLVRPEGAAYLFAHALIKEGVYGSLLNDRRRQLHRRSADWFESHDPNLFAEHLDRADDPGAVGAYLRAAQNEKLNFRFEKGIELAKRGSELARTPEDRCQLSFVLGDLLQESGEFGPSIAVFQQASENAESDELMCRALIGRGQGLLRTDRHLDAKECLETARNLAQTQSLLFELARINRLLATIAFAVGNSELSLELADKVIELAQNCNSPELEAQAWSTMADAQQAVGRHQDAMTSYQRCIEISREHNLRRVEAINLKMHADVRVYFNQLAAALEDYKAVIEVSAQLGDGRAEFLARGAAGIVCTTMGQFEEARDQFLAARHLIVKMDARRFLVNNNIVLANLAVESGDKQEAMAYLEAAEEVSGSLGMSWMRPWLLGTKTKVASNLEECHAAIAEAEAVFAAGEANYCRFEFYEAAIEGSLSLEDWDLVGRLADDFQSYFGPKLLEGARFLIDRSRALVTVGRGTCDQEVIETLHSLRDEAARMGRQIAIPKIDAALLSAKSN